MRNFVYNNPTEILFGKGMIAEIAGRVGYGRVHEFSRDYRKAYGCPPTAER